ncbi:lysophospholipase L1-like esterase [Mycolicibacterium sp. BK556]|uniref:SGNH/GDSL hydrolase family protein n=1 Tax=Mycobacteriaceae TaxID=1762 RepID=UPI001060E5A7|nr:MULTISPECIES: SGNH/GDSL hydrolase family protein [Mycobacteriaceae]MBB3605057.1 lysophospholipase L1-like esterase [Mycolicibacterium sp. BK556]MBB3635253.1 lysophospholipase L1-like esterase [Mycolicibacterium sp. BK607]MBB3747953.1 lysophospholipase L1-like esterase [Mycolicibacterium sp. BK634]TDO07912.1 GDSL-like lipase/acylhydrolase family protein [Mycobacterium sp. BK086]
MSRYVALGSSMAAGPGIKPRATGSPVAAGRSANNYPHLAAEQLGVDLVDVTYSGATTANVLREPQRGAPPQIDALDGSEELVTVTIGGNDVGYVPLLFAATLPTMLRSMPMIGGWLRDLLDPRARDAALDQVGASLREVGQTLREKSPRARILFVDYLTLLPPAGTPAPPLPDDVADLGRHVAQRLADETREAAQATGCEVVHAADASRDHHAWSADPWTIGAGSLLPWRPKPWHPNAAGMRAVADLIAATVRQP